ncbi:heavy-metal-associated domain-containing protein [Candidatus Woesearchaeota archaeon]|nr:heavy-metal-associated domain-containing protein [Candidatus Woesearchaeota archaeon]
MAKINLNIEGVHCNSCKMIIEDNLKDIGAKNVHVTVDEKTQKGTVACDYAGDKLDVVNAIKKEGYKVLK